VSGVSSLTVWVAVGWADTVGAQNPRPRARTIRAERLLTRLGRVATFRVQVMKLPGMEYSLVIVRDAGVC
jgi:hypothetical protein